MRMEVDHKIVCSISNDLTENLLKSIDEDDWYSSDYRKTVGTMGDVNSIPIHHTPLCASGMYTMQPIKDIRKEKMYDKFYPLIEPMLELLKEHYEFNQYSCFIARLRPKGTIGTHIDKGNFLEMCHRVHIPLKSNPKVRYVIGTNSYYWEVGNVYEFDNTRMHGVVNESDDYRIHLVVNLYNIPEEKLT